MPDPEQHEGAITIRLRRAHLWALAGLLVGVAAGIVIGRSGQDPRPVLYNAPSQGGTSSAPAASTTAPIKVSTAGSPAFGPRTAKVTVVEFVDFQCPFCGRYARDTFPRLKRDYGDRVRYVSRQFPLSIHPHARGAAIAAECADDQGGYWRYHRILFANQSSLGRRGLVAHAGTAGLDLARFRACLSSAAPRRRLSRDEADGRRYGVSATPTFFINGSVLTGAQP